MVNPVTVNAGIIVPLTGADVDVWGENDVNPNMVAIDGMLCGMQAISVTNVPITLTAPAGFTATPSGGPVQSQNRILRFTGAMTGNVTVTLPLPGAYIIENLTTGAFVLSFRGVTATEVIGFPQGERLEIYNDGANVRFANLARLGAIEMWSAISAIPAWVTACTVKPYLFCDGTIYNVSDYPWLGAKLGSTFGGNGLTTFGVPDLRGRYPLAYDGIGTRVTTAGGGINGQTMGAVGGGQSTTLGTTNLPAYTPSGVLSITAYVTQQRAGISYTSGGQQVWMQVPDGYPENLGPSNTAVTFNTASFIGNAQGGSSTAFTNLPPTQVIGSWVIKT